MSFAAETVAQSIVVIDSDDDDDDDHDDDKSGEERMDVSTDNNKTEVNRTLTSSAIIGKKRKSRPKNGEEVDRKRFQKLIDIFDWIVSDSNRFLRTGFVECCLCHCDISLMTVDFDADAERQSHHYYSGNATKHSKTDQHRIAVSKQNILATKDTNGTTFQHFRVSSHSIHANAMDIRRLLHASMISYGVNSNQIESILNPNAIVRRSTKILDSEGIIYGSTQTVRDDLPSVVNTIDDFIIQALEDEPVSIIVDSASLKHDSAMVILASTAKLEVPVLLTLITPTKKSHDIDPENDVYDFELAAKDIQLQLDAFKIKRSQITCVMGDNVNHNAAVARPLGVPLGKCFPHALALIVKNSYMKIELCRALIVDSSVIIDAGGTGKRRRELIDDFHLNPNRLKAYTNRFASVTDTAKYILENFKSVRDWRLTGKTLPKEKDNDDDDDDEEEDEIDMMSDEERPDEHSKKAREAYDKAIPAQLALTIHVELFGHIPSLVADLSGEFDDAPNNLVARLESLESVFALSSTEEGAVVVVNTCMQKMIQSGVELGLSQKAIMLERFKNQVKAASGMALQLYRKHFKVNLINYQRRERFHISREPSRGNEQGYLPQSFFGGPAQWYDIRLELDYRDYRKEWEFKSLEDPLWFQKITNYEYWESKIHIWPNLTRIAKWWANFPFSSIAAERTFALAHIIDMPRRGSLSWDSFTQELKIKVNKVIIEKILKQKLEKYEKNQSVIRK